MSTNFRISGSPPTSGGKVSHRGPLAAGVAAAALTVAIGISAAPQPASADEPCEITKFDIFDLSLGLDGPTAVRALNDIVARRLDYRVLDPKLCSTEGDATTSCPLYDPPDASASTNYSESDGQLVQTAIRNVEVRTSTSSYCAAAETWLAEADRRLDREFRMGEALQTLDGSGPIAAHVDREANGTVKGDRVASSMTCLDSVTIRSELPGEWASVLRVYFREGDKETKNYTSQKINAMGAELGKDEARKTKDRLLPLPPSEATKLSDQSIYRIEWYVHWLKQDEWQMLARDRMKARMLNDIYTPLRRVNPQILDKGQTHRYAWRAPDRDGPKGCGDCSVTFDLSYKPQMILVATLGQFEEHYRARADRRLIAHRLNQNDRNSVDMLLEPAKNTDADYADQERPFDLHRVPLPRPKPAKKASIKVPPPPSKPLAANPAPVESEGPEKGSSETAQLN